MRRVPQVETELRAALDSVSRDRSIAVKRLTGQVEDSTALLVRTREEHKVALAAYESQLTRWRDEAGHLAQKLKTIQAEHADVSCCQAANILLDWSAECGVESQDIERVKAAWAAKLEESGRAKPQEGDRGKEAAEDTEKDALAHQLADLLEVEAELVAERAQLRAELDRALLEKARAERAKNASQLRAAALQRQCDSLQVAGAASTASPAGNLLACASQFAGAQPLFICRLTSRCYRRTLP